MNIYYWIVGDYASSKNLYTYCGGIIMIAANTEEEAKNLLVLTYIDLFNSKTEYIDLDLTYTLENATVNLNTPTVAKVLIDEYYID